MESDIHRLFARANEGDAEAQQELAIRLHEGDGVPLDLAAAAKWLRQAAENGDAWARTTYAIELRSTKEAEKERESIKWFTLAAEQRDARARLTLGTQQSLGIGTEIDIESAAYNFELAKWRRERASVVCAVRKPVNARTVRANLKPREVVVS